MLCSSCRRTLLMRLHARTITTTPPPPTPPRSTTPLSPTPFSSPYFPDSGNGSSSTPKPPTKKPNKLASTLTAGTAMPALAYTKVLTAKPPVALEDHEYPAWLWGLLDTPAAEAADPSGLSAGDLAAMSAKKRAKLERKQAKLMEGRERAVPVHEQSRDLTAGDEGAVETLRRVQEVTRSAREARRKGIREDNFLRAM